ACRHTDHQRIGLEVWAQRRNGLFHKLRLDSQYPDAASRKDVARFRRRAAALFSPGFECAGIDIDHVDIVGATTFADKPGAKCSGHVAATDKSYGEFLVHARYCTFQLDPLTMFLQTRYSHAVVTALT